MSTEGKDLSELTAIKEDFIQAGRGWCAGLHSDALVLPSHVVPGMGYDELTAPREAGSPRA